MLDRASIRIDIFSYSISEILWDNLPPYIISTVSDMLALHYYIDVSLKQAQPNIQKYANLCSLRLKNFLQEKVIIEENFSTALSLFTIAITPEVIYQEDLPSLNKVRDQEKVSEVISQVLVGEEISDKELEILSDVVDNILGKQEAGIIVEFMSANPKVILKILKGRRQKIEEISEILRKAASAASKATLISTDFAQLAGLVACSMLAFVGNVVAISSFTAIAAAAIIPVSIAALKYGSEIGEKLGTSLVRFEKNFQAASREVQNLLHSIVPDTIPEIAIHQKQEIVQETAISKIDLQDITKDLAAHIDFSSASPVRNARLDREKSNERSK